MARSRRRRAARISASATLSSSSSGVQLGGFGAGVAEAAAYGFDGHSRVDQLGGMDVAELVDVEVQPRRPRSRLSLFRVSGAGVVKLGDQEFDALSFAART